MRQIFGQGALCARKIIEELVIGDPAQINLEAIAARLNVEISEADVDGFDGAVQKIREPRCGLITVRRSIREHARKRFVIAHELGHYQMPDHWEEQSLCTVSDVEYQRLRTRRSEVEADEFAAELLMPEPLFRPRALSQSPGMDAIRQLAGEFHTSLTATAVRFVQLTARPCAVVLSTDARIKWYGTSETFHGHMRTGGRLDLRSCASVFFRTGSLEESATLVTASTWIKNKRMKQDLQITEHSIALPFYDAVLTLLYVDENTYPWSEF